MKDRVKSVAGTLWVKIYCPKRIFSHATSVIVRRLHSQGSSELACVNIKSSFPVHQVLCVNIGWENKGCCAIRLTCRTELGSVDTYDENQVNRQVYCTLMVHCCLRKI